MLTFFQILEYCFGKNDFFCKCKLFSKNALAASAAPRAPPGLAAPLPMSYGPAMREASASHKGPEESEMNKRRVSHCV